MSSMRAIRFLFVLGFISLILGSQSKSFGSPGNTDSSKTIGVLVSNITAYFDQIQSIEYDYSRSSVENGVSTTVHWQEKGSMYRFDWAQKGFANQTETQAYDGKHYQFIKQTNNRLYISQTKSTRFGHGFRLSQDMLLTAPFQWLHPPTPNNLNDLLTVPFLKSVDIASILGLASHVRTVTKNSLECIEITLPGGVDQYTKVPYTYNVYFSVKDNYFPIGWDAVDKDNKLIYHYQVTELGKITPATGIFFLYPKTATLGWFEESGKDTPLGVDTFRITNFFLNSLSDDGFTIDPSTASAIEDLDAKQVIEVPR
jgi:hypothetical protein